MKKCLIDWCQKPAKKNGKYCSAHYEERRKYGKFLTQKERAENKKKNDIMRTEKIKEKYKDPKFRKRLAELAKERGLKHRTICIVDGCENRARAKGYCPKHYHHVKKYGGALIGDIRPNRGKGRTVTGNGYIQIFLPHHPFANQRGYVFEHRLIMEKYLGRYLSNNEVVHHKDRNKQNNNIENLRLFASQSQHIKAEVKEKRRMNYA